MLERVFLFAGPPMTQDKLGNPFRSLHLYLPAENSLRYGMSNGCTAVVCKTCLRSGTCYSAGRQPLRSHLNALFGPYPEATCSWPPEATYLAVLFHSCGSFGGTRGSSSPAPEDHCVLSAVPLAITSDNMRSLFLLQQCAKNLRTYTTAQEPARKGCWGEHNCGFPRD